LPLLLPDAPVNVQEAVELGRLAGPVCHRADTSLGVSKLLLGTARKFAVGVLQTAAELVLVSDPNTVETE
jgi:hypothetical protein